MANLSKVERIKQNIENVRKRIDEAAKRAGRNASEITLVAVTKTASLKQVKEAVEAGIIDFGENRVQVAKEKVKYFSDISNINWHMIGHLQTNKVKDAVKIFKVIHSVDSIKLAKEINKEAGKLNFTIPVFIEVNVSGEQSKFGIKPEEIHKLREIIDDLEYVKVKGLMTMAPFFSDPQMSRPYFKRLFQLAEEEGLKELSMGMSDDFDVAIEEGATIIRVGRAIFGNQ